MQNNPAYSGFNKTCKNRCVNVKIQIVETITGYMCQIFRVLEKTKMFKNV